MVGFIATNAYTLNIVAPWYRQGPCHLAKRTRCFTLPAKWPTRKYDPAKHAVELSVAKNLMVSILVHWFSPGAASCSFEMIDVHVLFTRCFTWEGRYLREYKTCFFL